ncbi:hypothetical protein QTG54_015820 [Skeletonema marinoi]|uniref:PDZ domain-containing protein n=1 Tax=Skeletonema marinoi TaxID=267567 RepID=A0AAD8XTP4_9STRA|nr:hypothetical protein QTG54_015820 [Skeletonema marinoi]
MMVPPTKAAAAAAAAAATAATAATKIKTLNVAPGKIGLTLKVNLAGATVTSIESSSGCNGKIDVGDVIVAIDGRKLQKVEDCHYNANKARQFTIVLKKKEAVAATTCNEYSLLPLKSQVPPHVIEETLSIFRKKYAKEIAKLKIGAKPNVEINHIFNETQEVTKESKRYQLAVDRRTTLYKSDLVSKHLIPIITKYCQDHYDGTFEIHKTLLLMSDAFCPEQKEHTDGIDNANDFIVALFTLQDNTYFRIRDRLNRELKELVMPQNTLLFFHSLKLHAGGRNPTNEINFRLHFRIGRKHDRTKSISMAEQIRFPETCCYGCGRTYTIYSSRKNHEYTCSLNKEGDAHRAAENDQVRELRAGRKRVRLEAQEMKAT